MEGQLKNVFKQSAIYSIGNFANKIIGFVLLPLYTDYLTIDDYGVLGLLEVMAVVPVTVLSFRIPTAMIRWCSDTENEEEQKSILYTSFIGIFIIGLSLNACLFPFSKQFAVGLFNNIDFTIFFQLLFVSIGIELLSKVPLEFLRFKQKSTLFISINIIKLIVVLGLNIYLIAWLNWGIKGILISQIVGHGIVLLLTSKYLISNFSYRFNAKAAKEMAYYGFPLVFSSLAGVLLSLADRFILPYFHEYGDLGLYTLGYKIASVTNVFLITSFQLGFLPIAFKRYKDPQFKPFISKILTYFTFLVVLCTLFISFFSQEVIKTFSKNIDYWDAYNLVPLIGFLFIFKAIQYVFTLGLHFEKRTKLNINIVVLGLIVNITLNILLIPKYDIIGAIIASIISGLVTLLYSYRLSMRIYPVRYEIRKIVVLVGISTIFVMLLFLVNPLEIIPRIGLKFALLSLFLFLVWLSGYFEKDEISFANRIIKKYNPFRK